MRCSSPCARRCPDYFPGGAPVLRIAVPPFTGAVLTNLSVLRSGGDLVASGFGAPPPLTIRFAADRLSRLKLRRLESALTIATSPLDHIGVVALKDRGKNLETVI